MVLQAPGGEGLFLDPVSLGQDGLTAAAVDVGGREVAQALVGAGVIVVLHEGPDLLLEIARQEVVLEQDPVLQRLVPALDFALRLRVPASSTPAAKPGCASSLSPVASSPFAATGGSRGSLHSLAGIRGLFRRENDA